MVRKGIFFIILSIIWLKVFSQYFQTGQDPASIKWRQLNTDNFQVIYPGEFEEKANQVAYLLEKVYQYNFETTGFKPKKISVILHTQTVKSNGLVAIAPTRSELYTTPNQSIYPQDWLEQLAIHEFTHVIQVNKVEQEVPLLLRLLFGQQITAAVMGIFVPWWLIEGDAVTNETALSRYGRGRLPSFLMEHHAQVVEKGRFSYDKAYLGSYKDFVPNHYKLGYYLAGEGRNKFGRNLWDNVFNDLGANPFTFTPVKWSLKRQTGYTLKGLYEAVFDSLQEEWASTTNEFDRKMQDQLSKPVETYTSYQYNHYLDNQHILTLKSSYKSIPQFVTVDRNGNETKVYTPGTIFDESASCSGNTITWSEQVPDPRWEHSGKSLLHIYNIESKSHERLHTGYKAFSPSVSPDKKQVAVVEVDFKNNYFISLYDLGTKKLTTRFQTGSNNYFFTPRWINNEKLVVIVLTNNGKRLAVLNPYTKEMMYLTDESLGEIKHPLPYKNYIFFISGYGGRDDLYVYDLSDNQVKQVYQSEFGVGYPAISSDGKKIALSNYTSNGFTLIEIPYSQDDWKPLEQVQKVGFELAVNLAGQEEGKLEFSDYSDKGIKYPSKKYSKLLNLFHFHSWAPVFFDINSYDVQPGVTLMSQNKLGTAETTLGYKWSLEEETGRYYANFSYKGWYPILSAELNFGKRASEFGEITQYVNNQGQVVRRDTTFTRYTWKESSLDLSAKLPLDFTMGKFYRLIQPEVVYQLSNYSVNSSTPDGFPDGTGQTMLYRLYFHQLLKQSYQDVYPDFGIIADATYRHSPWGNFNYGDLFAVHGFGYLPGVLPNHGLRGYYGYQKRTDGINSNFSDGIRYPRGWNSRDNNTMYSMSLDYKFPLLYPDNNLGSIIYVKRLKASLFADYAHQTGYVRESGQVVGSFSRDMTSLGVELTGDMHFFRFYAPVELGVRAAYLPEKGAMHFGMLFSIDFNSL